MMKSVPQEILDAWEDEELTEEQKNYYQLNENKGENNENKRNVKRAKK